ncbi:MAG TPA: TIGR03435 family protein [Candidatus Acidoferrum sp.]|nr:TIGR03435 family protein [Candidatus Acidoferrum sp.]
MGRFGYAAVAALIVFSMLGAAPSWAQSQSSSASAPMAGPPLPPVYEYEVASFRPFKPGSEGPGVMRFGMSMAPDSFSASGYTMQALITMAYGIRDFQLSGAPSWLNSERYDVDAKMDGSVADALQRLSPDDRNAMRQKMLQALLADRLKLTIHRDTKEGQIYNLVIGKNGPKLKEATAEESAATPPTGPRGGGGGGAGTRGGGGGAGLTRGGPGMMTMSTGRGGTQSLSMQAVPISNLIDMLARNVGRPVVDKTGLTGKYDIKLEWTRDDLQVQTPPGGAPSGAPAPPPPDSSGPTLFAAIQDQLGLKLESGKGPIENIVIDHVEKPSEN